MNGGKTMEMKRTATIKASMTKVGMLVIPITYRVGPCDGPYLILEKKVSMEPIPGHWHARTKPKKAKYVTLSLLGISGRIIKIKNRMKTKLIFVAGIKS